MRTYIALVSLLLLALLAEGSAQIVTVDYTIVANKTIANSGVDSVLGIPLVYSGVTYAGQLEGVRPDSMRIEWRSTGDSVASDVAVAFNFMGSGYTAYATKDSIKAAELDFWLFPRSTYASSDLLTLKNTARSTGNSLIGGTKLWMHVRQYFTLPKR